MPIGEIVNLGEMLTMSAKKEIRKRRVKGQPMTLGFASEDGTITTIRVTSFGGNKGWMGVVVEDLKTEDEIIEEIEKSYNKENNLK